MEATVTVTFVRNDDIKKIIDEVDKYLASTDVVSISIYAPSMVDEIAKHIGTKGIAQEREGRRGEILIGTKCIVYVIDENGIILEIYKRSIEHCSAKLLLMLLNRYMEKCGVVK